VKRLRWRVVLVVMAACLVVLSHSAQAQRPRRGLRRVFAAVPELGPRVGYDFKADDWLVGGQLRIPGPYLESLFSGDYYLEGATRPWQLNLDLAVRLRPLASFYAGGGIGIFHDLTTDVGPNVLVGLHPPARRGAPVRPYVEGRWTFLNGGTPFRLVFGINLLLGR
jgi:hypothetical protein